MIPAELLKKIQRIEITTRRMVDDAMSGQFRSHFKGHGVQFSEHRPYVAGDDIRHIDWKVSARTRDPLVKKFEEERELTVLVLIDVSTSQEFGTEEKPKREVAAEAAAMIAWAATRTGDKVGVVLVSGGVDQIIPPKKGRNHVLRIIRTVLEAKAVSSGTGLAQGLNAAGRAMKHAGVVFVISDFIATDFDFSLKKLARRHDVVAIVTEDRWEREVVPAGLGRMRVVDLETGKSGVLKTDLFTLRRWYEEWLAKREEIFKAGRVEWLRLRSNESQADALVRFFRQRRSKSRTRL
ncbi:MAG: DUF58 domain-containing protein [Bdellovibrionota bacterium]